MFFLSEHLNNLLLNNISNISFHPLYVVGRVKAFSFLAFPLVQITLTIVQRVNVVLAAKEKLTTSAYKVASEWKWTYVLWKTFPVLSQSTVCALGQTNGWFCCCRCAISTLYRSDSSVSKTFRLVRPTQPKINFLLTAIVDITLLNVFYINTRLKKTMVMIFAVV